MQTALVAFLSLLLLGVAPLHAEQADGSECRVLSSTGDRFCKFGNTWKLMNARPAPFGIDDDFPVYQHSMLMDLSPYNLPPVDGPWRYYILDGFIYKVSAATGKVIEVVGRAVRH